MKLGASNKFFYYTRMDEGSFMMNPQIIFKDDLQIEALKDAFNKAIELYPELGTRTVIRNGITEAVPNEEPVAFYPDDGKRYAIGSDEVNGHLFCIRYGKDYIKASIYHGMFDYKGLMALFRTALYFYAQNIGLDTDSIIENEIFNEIRSDKSKIPNDDPLDMWDPYSKYADPDAVSEYSYDYPQALGINVPMFEAGSDYVHHYLIEFQKDDYIKKTRELRVSFVPLLVDTISGAVLRQFGNGDLPVVAMVPADLRPLFDSKTLVNFSDSLLFAYYPEYEKMSVSERCMIFKDLLKKQRNRENFAKMMASKIADVRNFEMTPIDAPKQETVQTAPPVRRITYALTYPGNLDFGYGLDEIIKDQFVNLYVFAFAATVYTYRDKMRIQVLQRTDDPGFPECIVKAFRDFIPNAELIDNGHYRPDLVWMNKLRRIE